MRCGANFQWWRLFALSWATSTWQSCSTIRLVWLKFSSIDESASISHFFTASSLKTSPPLKHGSVQIGRVQTSLIFTVFSLNIQNLTQNFPLEIKSDSKSWRQEGVLLFNTKCVCHLLKIFLLSPLSVYITVYLSLSDCPQQPGVCQTYECHFPLSLLSCRMPLWMCVHVCVCVCDTCLNLFPFRFLKECLGRTHFCSKRTD